MRKPLDISPVCRLRLAMCVRVVLAAVFVFSGLAKAVDPLGSGIKIYEYLSAFGLPRTQPLSLAAGTCQALLEFWLGALLLTGIWRRAVAAATLAVMAFMTALTLFIAIKEPVSDCGCFGDALRLGNTATFLKNVALLSLAAAYMWLCRLRLPQLRGRALALAMAVSVLLPSFFAYRGLFGLPLIDYRPFRVGQDLRAAVAKPATTYLYQLRKNGVSRLFTAEQYPDSTWQFEQVVERTEDTQNALADFTLQRAADGSDATEAILSRRGMGMWLVGHADASRMPPQVARLRNEVAAYCLSNGLYFNQILPSGSATAAGDTLTLFADLSTLQTMLRPAWGLLLVSDGRVANKWAAADAPRLKGKNEPSPQKLMVHRQLPSPLAQTLIIVAAYMAAVALLFLCGRRSKLKKNS